jgi:hypothetical protein
MADAAFAIREIELYERPVVLRLPFRFGVVTLTQCPQAFVRARIEFADGESCWGAAAEMMAPKWFDKDLQLSNEDNFNQLRNVLRLARDAYLGDSTATSAFGHFARNYDPHLRTATALGYNPLLANYGPAVIAREAFPSMPRCNRICPASVPNARSSPSSISIDSSVPCNPRRQSKRATRWAWSTPSPRAICASASATGCPKRWKK